MNWKILGCFIFTFSFFLNANATEILINQTENDNKVDSLTFTEFNIQAICKDFIYIKSDEDKIVCLDSNQIVRWKITIPYDFEISCTKDTGIVAIYEEGNNKSFLGFDKFGNIKQNNEDFESEITNTKYGFHQRKRKPNRMRTLKNCGCSHPLPIRCYDFRVDEFNNLPFDSLKLIVIDFNGNELYNSNVSNKTFNFKKNIKSLETGVYSYFFMIQNFKTPIKKMIVE